MFGGHRDFSSFPTSQYQHVTQSVLHRVVRTFKARFNFQRRACVLVFVLQIYFTKSIYFETLPAYLITLRGHLSDSLSNRSEGRETWTKSNVGHGTPWYHNLIFYMMNWVIDRRVRSTMTVTTWLWYLLRLMRMCFTSQPAGPWTYAAAPAEGCLQKEPNEPLDLFNACYHQSYQTKYILRHPR